ncbi:hypothetical protein AOHp86_14180 [Helicobacter pylori]
MFQPLLDAFIESTHLDETTHKPPLNIALANWWPLKNSEKKRIQRLHFACYPKTTLQNHFTQQPQ